MLSQQSETVTSPPDGSQQLVSHKGFCLQLSTVTSL